MKIISIALLSFLTCGSATISSSAPEPAIVQGPNLWTFEATFTHPDQIMIKTAPDQAAQRFWYVILSLTNKSGKDVEFYPKCELMTDTFKFYLASQGVPGIVFDKIKSRHKTKYPLLESIEFVDSKILQGSDNTKDVAVIFPDFDAKAKNIKIFLAGLSNETAVVELPDVNGKQDAIQEVYLRKTLELNYAIPGDPSKRSEAKLDFKAKRWIMR